MRKAFTMIELILTIVILAIATMAIPNMIAQTAELNTFALKQELALNAKTVMSQIVKFPWDTSVGICEVTNKSIGGVDYSIRHNVATHVDKNASKLDGIVEFDPVKKNVKFEKYNNNTIRNMNDFDKLYWEFDNTVTDNTSRGDFILHTRVYSQICYVANPFDENCVEDSTNIKKITVTAVDQNDPNNYVKIRYYAFNIGFTDK